MHNSMSKRALLAVILSLAWPTMLEQLMQTAVQYIDMAMVGALGTYATAAVGATNTIGWLVNSSISALGVGFLAFVAKAYGADDRPLAVKAVTQAVLAALVSGIFFTVLALSLSGLVPVWMQVDPAIRPLSSQYFFILYLPMLPRAAILIFGTLLRAVGDTKTPMRIGLMVNLINVLLNFLLIYPTRTLTVFSVSILLPGMDMGVLGAASASAVAFTVGGLAMTRALWRHPIISPKGQKLRPDKTVLLPCLKVALPNMLQRFSTSLGYVVYASMINSVGEIATAAHTIANTVESAFYIPGYGMQMAAATLAGNSYGAGDKKRMQALARMTLWVEVVLMVGSGSLLFAFAPFMMGLFSTDQSVILLGATVLRMVAVSEPFYGVSIIIEGILQGVGKTGVPFVFHTVGMWGIRMVGTFLCIYVFGMGLVAAWACMIFHNLLLFVLFVVYYVRGRWNPFGLAKTSHLS